MASESAAWELPSEDMAKAKNVSDLNPWQFTTKRLLIAICVIGLSLPPILNTAGWFYYASARMNWQPLHLEDVPLLSKQKQYAIVMRGVGHWPICGDGSCFDNHALRVKVGQVRCSTYQLSMPDDAPVLAALQERFPGLKEQPGFLLMIDHGKAVPNASERFGYEFAEQLNAFKKL